MAARFLIIDGYNLLHAAGMAQREYARGELQRCRLRLIRFLLEKLSAAELVRATLVFDARVPPPDRAPEFRVRGLRVQFANPGGDADEFIERLLHEHSAAHRITLVSSDHRLQSAARRQRALFVESDQFFDQLAQRKRTTREGNFPAGHPYDELKQGRSLTTGELSSWKTVFGDIPGATWELPPPARESQADSAPRPSAELPKISTPGSPPAESPGLSTPSQRAAFSPTAASPPPSPPSRTLPAPPPSTQTNHPAVRPKKPGKNALPAQKDPIPDVTWDDLCRWLENDRWLTDYLSDADPEK